MVDQDILGSGGFIDPDSIVGSLGIQSGMKIADFGAGSGYFTILLGKLVGDSGIITAIDILDSALDSIRSKAEQIGLQNVKTVKSNLEVSRSSNLSDGSQDMILLANVLFQSDNKKDILREAYRVLNNKGKLIVIDWKKGTGGGPSDNLRLEPFEMQSLIEKIGFNFRESINAGRYHYGLKFTKG